MGEPSAPLRPEPTLNADILALVADSVICTDEGGHILVFNAAAERCFGYSASEVLGREVEVLLQANQRAEHIRHVRSFMTGEGAANRLMGKRGEVVGRRKNGDEFPVEAMVSRQAVDGVTILTVVSRDITRRKELEELRDAAAREQELRLKNVLAVVNSLITLTASNAANVEEFRDSLVGRVRALAATQNALRFGQQTSTSLIKLLLAELDQCQAPDGSRIVISGPDVSVGATAAQLLALAVHELATNSAKYGALQNAGGHVSVTLAHSRDEADQL